MEVKSTDDLSEPGQDEPRPHPNAVLFPIFQRTLLQVLLCQKEVS